MSFKKKSKIVLSGGGTGGSVTPLLQIYKDLKDDFDFLFIGTQRGIEKKIVKTIGITYRSIYSGKWRRYFSWKNFTDLFLIFIAFWQSLIILIRERPQILISAGGFVAVPLSYAARFLRIPVIVHQQDVLPGLANKLMAPVAKVITVTFSSALDYYGSKARWIGNLGPQAERKHLSQSDLFAKYGFNNSEDRFLLLVLGGGTGSLFINNLIKDSIERLASWAQVIHLSGQEDRDFNLDLNLPFYHKINFIDHDDFLSLLSQANLVISRCGLATLSELSFLGKAAILIPMPKSHQELNALEFEKKEAAVVLQEENLNADKIIKVVESLANNQKQLELLEQNVKEVIKNANQEMTSIIYSLLKK